MAELPILFPLEFGHVKWHINVHQEIDGNQQQIEEYKLARITPVHVRTLLAPKTYDVEPAIRAQKIRAKDHLGTLSVHRFVLLGPDGDFLATGEPFDERGLRHSRRHPRVVHSWHARPV